MNITRRSFLKLAGLGGLSLGLPALPRGLQTIHTAKRGNTLNTARNCIFVFLDGGPSHVDSFDFKEGSWTPANFGGTTLSSGARWPDGIMPQLAQRDHQFSLLRSIEGHEIQHERAIYFLDNARRINPAFQAETPGIGSVAAYEFAGQRGENDIFPSYVSIARRPPSSGYLSSLYAGYYLEGAGSGTLIKHPGGESDFNRRLAALKSIDPARTGAVDALGYRGFYEQAENLMYRPGVNAALHVDEATKERYSHGFGGYQIGASCALAFQLIQQDFGVRFVHIGFSGWDNHGGIYHTIGSRLGALDLALANLFDDLEQTPGVFPGNSLLDETLVLVMGEFGRTPGALNATGGRDHHRLAFSALLAGGGVKGGRVIGASDAIGERVVDPGWQAGRPVTNEDLAMTLYSALGIDGNKALYDAPSGRTFYYVPRSSATPPDIQAITELFT